MAFKEGKMYLPKSSKSSTEGGKNVAPAPMKRADIRADKNENEGGKIDVPKSSKSSTKTGKISAPTPMMHSESLLVNNGSFGYVGPTFGRGTTALAFIFDKRNNDIYRLFKQISGGHEYLLHLLKSKYELIQSTAGRKPLVAELLAWLSRTVRDHKLQVGILIAMWDDSKPSLYRINYEGVVDEGNVLVTGSGSAGAAVIKINLKNTMTVDDAADLAKRALLHIELLKVGTNTMFTTLEAMGAANVCEGYLRDWNEADLMHEHWKFNL